MRRAVHVAHQMHQILDADHDRRVVQRLVVAQQLHRILDSLDRIAVGLARGIVLVVVVDPGGMPQRGVGVLRLETVGVHPRSVVYDGGADVLFDRFLRFGRKVAFGDVGDGVVAHFPPAESGVEAENQRRGEQEERLFHFRYCGIG